MYLSCMLSVERVHLLWTDNRVWCLRMNCFVGMVSLPLWAKLLGTTAAAACLTAASMIGYGMWTGSTLFNPNAGRFDPLYLKDEWFGYLIFCYCAPIAFALFFTVAQSTIRFFADKSASVYYIVTIAIAAALAYIAIAGASLLTSFWQCGFVFCVNTPDKWIEDPEMMTDRGIGFYTNVGFLFGAPAMFLGIAVLSNAITHAMYHKFHHRATSTKGVETPLLSDVDTQGVEGADNAVELSGVHFTTPRNTTFVPDAKAAAKLSQSPVAAHPYYGYSHTLLRRVEGESVDRRAVLERRVWGGQYLLLCVCICFLVAFWLTTTMVPNLWRNVSPTRIAAQAMMRVETDKDICGGRGPHTCPEYGWAVFKTQQVMLSKFVYMKFFPSLYLYYGFLVLLPLLAVAARWPCWQRFWSAKVRISSNIFGCLCSRYHDRKRRVAFFSRKEVAAILLTLAFLSVFTWYWYADHNYKNRWPQYDDSAWIDVSERIMRTLGQCAVVVMALLLFPAARNSPVLALFGISWEAAIQYHRWLGVLFVLLTLGHVVVGYVWFWRMEGSLWLMFRIPFEIDAGLLVEDFSVPMIQYVTWLSFITFGVFSCFEYFRRCHFDLFLVSHHLTYIILVPAVLWHASVAWEYMVPAIFVWLVDRMVRAYRSTKAVHLVVVPPAGQQHTLSIFDPASVATVTAFNDRHNATHASKRVLEGHTINSSDGANAGLLVTTLLADASVQPRTPPISPFSLVSAAYPAVCAVRRGAAGEFIELRLSNACMQYSPGQYAFLNVAEVSAFEWHPMTIASPVHSTARPEVVFVIKCMGKGTWTQSLFDYVAEAQRKAVDRDPSLAQRHAEAGYTPVDYVPVPLTVSVDGPYGKPVDFLLDYDDVVLVGGGVGITPCKSIFESLYLSYLHDYIPHATRSGSSAGFDGHDGDHADAHSIMVSEPLASSSFVGSAPAASDKRVHMLFIARDASLFHLVEESFSHIPEGPFTSDLYCTGDNKKAPATLAPQVRYGRPQLQDTLARFVARSGEKKRRVLLFVCGPEPLSRECEELCYAQGWDFHTEVFDL